VLRLSLEANPKPSRNEETAMKGLVYHGRGAKLTAEPPAGKPAPGALADTT
jgi:hypothetical protein